MKELIEPSEARQRIAAHLPNIPTIDCPVDKCAGRALRQNIVTDRPFPPFDRSMMDGYALRASDAKHGLTLKLTGMATAGAPRISNGEGPNDCVEIMTGAILPEMADCVVPYENTERTDDGQIRLTDEAPIHPGDFIHRKGSDFDAGAALLQTGQKIGSREVAAAATCGYAKLKVSKIPRIAIACSGDELVAVDQKPEPHQIRRSNDSCIETGLARIHLNAEKKVHLPDEPEIVYSKLKSLIEQNDFVILSGGISMGKKDFIPETLDELGLTCHFHGIAQKPGKPMGYWTTNHCAVFALPGNPLSTLTCLHHYVIPALEKALGLDSADSHQSVLLNKSESVRKDTTVFLPVAVGSNNTASPCQPQNSGDLVRILQSNGYIMVPPGEAEATQGKAYTFYPWH
ncbi:MAG: molybdopterin molybdotransferase MoeA [Verrucomicrobiota bacterium]